MHRLNLNWAINIKFSRFDKDWNIACFIFDVFLDKKRCFQITKFQFLWLNLGSVCVETIYKYEKICSWITSLVFSLRCAAHQKKHVLSKSRLKFFNRFFCYIVEINKLTLSVKCQTIFYGLKWNKNYQLGRCASPTEASWTTKTKQKVPIR